MKLFFSIYDKKSGLYDFVQSFKSEADAVRAVRSLVNTEEKSSLISQYPSDYEVYRIGAFDPLTGRFDSVEPEFIVGLGVLVDLPKEVSNVA